MMKAMMTVSQLIILTVSWQTISSNCRHSFFTNEDALKWHDPYAQPGWTWEVTATEIKEAYTINRHEHTILILMWIKRIHKTHYTGCNKSRVPIRNLEVFAPHRNDLVGEWCFRSMAEWRHDCSRMNGCESHSLPHLCFVVVSIKAWSDSHSCHYSLPRMNPVQGSFSRWPH